eukprot:gene3656-biopygen11301
MASTPRGTAMLRKRVNTTSKTTFRREDRCPAPEATQTGEGGGGGRALPKAVQVPHRRKMRDDAVCARTARARVKRCSEGRKAGVLLVPKMEVG